MYTTKLYLMVILPWLKYDTISYALEIKYISCYLLVGNDDIKHVSTDCTGDVFQCKDDLWCVPNEEVCDSHGTRDCNDGSDQQNCEFILKNGKRCMDINILH